jgi:hypothetical protein
MERTHHGQHGPDCFGCKAQTVAISAHATPGRRPDAVFHADRERQWAKDHQAVRTLAKQGITPAHCDGAAELANRATSAENIQRGIPA